MGNDDKQDDDPLAGKIDPVNFAARFQRVADIVARAQARFNKVAIDPGPLQDPAVQTALANIVNNANALSAAASKLASPAGGPGTVP